MRRRRRHNRKRRFVLGKRKRHLARMQMHHFALKLAIHAVNIIAQNRPAHMGAMHPQLMRAPGERFQLQPRQRGAIFDAAPQHLPARLRGRAACIHLHPPAPIRILRCERQINQTLRLRRPANNNRPIGLVYLAALKQQHHLFKRLAVPPENETSGGVLVEPMRQSWISRQAKGQKLQGIFQRFAALRPAMHRQPCGLVQHQYQTIAVEQTR